MFMPIKLKQSSVAAKQPSTTDLQLGELAVNTNDGKLYLKKSVSGTESIVEVSGDKVPSSRITISSSSPTGGSDNDIWFKYTP